MFYPETACPPLVESQNKMIDRYFCFVLSFIVDQHKFTDYINYNCNFIEEQVIDLSDFGVWESHLKENDYKMLRHLYLTLYHISYTYYQYIIERHKLDDSDQQMTFYSKLKGDYYNALLFNKKPVEEEE